jgi:TonB-linked SusC/RagA family outer membrane protein
MRHPLLCLGIFMILTLPVTLHAQVTSTITGKVVDSTGKPLYGVSVKQLGAKGGTSSDAGGNFQLRVTDPNGTIEFSFIGLNPQKIKLAGKASLMVTMKANPNHGNLQDIVVIGSQQQSRRLTTTAVSTVSGKDIENLPAPSVDELLQGRVAGLNVQVSSGEPGVAPTVVVRGNTKINTGIGNDPNVSQAQALSSPLYVIDGVPVNPADIANAIDNTGTNYLAGISVNDIESVDVQKDAAATAAWGSRGANGVIYIKTRRGRSPVPEFRVNVYGGITKQPQLLQTPTGQAERDEKYNIINQYAGYSNLSNLPILLTDSLNPYFNNATDWQGLFYREGAVQNVDMTMSAANESVNYRLSLNYYNEKGIIEDFGYKRYSLRGNFDFKINPKLDAQFIVAMSVGDRQKGRKFYNSIDGSYNDDNTPVSGASQPSSLYHLTAFDSANFTGIYSKLRNKNINDLYSASLTLNYNILPGLKFNVLGSADISTSDRDYFQPANVDQVAAAAGTQQESYAEADRGSYTTYFVSTALNYGHKFKAGKDHYHEIAITANQQFNVDEVNTSVVDGYNVPSNNIQVVSNVPQSDLAGSSDHQSDGLLSWIAQAQYDYDGKYLVYGSFRGDASSRFGNNTKWGTFPAAGVGWIVSDEKFMEPIQDVVKFLKIRASYGISGSQSPNFYAPYNSYVIPGTYNGALAVQPSYTNGLTKNDLTWAKTEQKNLGFDVQLFNTRLTFSVDIYDKISKDDYYDFQLPFYTGFSTVNFNAHDLWVSNRGADFTINSHNLGKSSALQWNTQLTLSYNKNAIAKLPNNNRTFTITDYYGVERIFEVGQPIYEMFQLKYTGVYNNQSQIPFDALTGKPITYFKGNHTVVPGDPIWKDVNKIGDVWTDEDNGNQYGDLVPSGNPNPRFTGGLVNDFAWKNFTASILCVFTWKRDIVNTFFQQQVGNIVGGYSSSIYTFANDRLPDFSKVNYWTPAKAGAKANYQANFPSINPFGPSYYQYTGLSSQFNANGSYLKVQNILLSYQLPKSVVNISKTSRVKVYCTVDNVLTLKKADIPDPESVDQLGIYSGGVYPLPRKYTFGLDLQF